jgi:hypothetical protein
VAPREKSTADVPPFPSLKWDGYCWGHRIVLPAWTGFQARQGGYGSVSSPKPSTGAARLRVQSPGKKAGPKPPSAEQAAAYRYLLGHEEAVRDAVLRANFAAYPGWKADIDFGDEADASMPDIDRPEQLKHLVGLFAVHLLKVAKGGAAYVGFEFGCTWDEEHGLGALTHRRRVVEVGQADVAFTEWAARRDLKPSKKLPTKPKRGSGSA